VTRFQIFFALAILVIAPKVLLADSGDSGNTEESIERPNILWLTSEDNSVDWVGCYGYENANTPNIDQLAREGFRYTHCYANAPVCAPMRSTWITGVMAVSMGTHHMRSYHEIPHNKIKLYPDFLNAAGYHTGNFKKTDYNFSGRPVNECWDSSKAVDWQKLQKKQPFFQVINHHQSHESKAFGNVDNTRHDPEKTQLAKYHPDVPDMRENYAHYHDAVQNMDQEIGNALKQLKDAGLADNTIVVYCSDHGGVLPRSKRFLFRSGLHCPLIVRIPERYQHLWPSQQPGNTVDRLVSFVDMPKTWLSITGSEVPDVMQGKIFLGPEAEPEQDYHFAFRGRMDERLDNSRAIVDKRFVYIRNYMPYVPWMQRLTYLWQMKAAQAWDKAVRNGTANEVQSRYYTAKGYTEELYDMQSDPDNVNNLIDQPEVQETIAAMRKELRSQQLAIYDAGLMPESDLVRLAKENNTTIYDLVRDQKLYDVAALLDAADLALAKEPSNLPKLRELLDHDHRGMRYWGIVGCFLLNDAKAGQKAIADASHEVRAMAAWLLVRTGNKEQGYACLADLLKTRSYAAVTAMNVIDWIGDDAQPLAEEVRKLEYKETFRNQYKYEIRMKDILVNRFGNTK